MAKRSTGREIIDLNDGWIYFDQNIAANKITSLSAGKGQKVTLPHANRVLPHHNFDEKDYQFISWYRNSFKLPAGAKGKRVFVEFDGVMLAAKVYLNGKSIGEHKGGFTGFRFDLTKHIKPGSTNTLAVQVDSRERPDIPPFGGIVDYLTFGGIYREARLIITDSLYIEDMFVCGFNVLKESRTLICQYDLNNTSTSRKVDLIFRLKDDKNKVIAETRKAVTTKSKKRIAENICLQELPDVKLWDIDQPYLYRTELVIEEDGQCIDRVEKSFGFREAHFSDNGKFYLNGKTIKLVGLDRHQNYAYLGPAVGWRMQYRDAEIMKNEMGLNVVRTSHYPQSSHFLDRCDQLGLLVFEEIPGWQFIGNKKWQQVSLDELKEMVIRDRHHPSIILWGVRINESKDNHDFYTKTNELAHKLDPTRQTGGVRALRESEFLEDVFTYNDFSGYVQKTNHTPYLITEFAGHTYPTKSFDQVERMIHHALLHAKIQNQQIGNPYVSGAIGWCAFDYNTHLEFGSGDRICYHGVSDIFRLPKYAADFYKSQKSPQQEVVLEVADSWARGDWSMRPEFLIIFSNCDEIEARFGSKKIGTFKPDTKQFPNLKHPPFKIDNIIEKLGDWGGRWQDLKVIGKIKGKAVIRKQFPANKIPVKLDAWLDHNEIVADGRDMTQLSFMMVDKFGNICPFATGAVTVKAGAGVEVIGENPFALIGGKGALFVKAGRKKGTVKIKLTCTSGEQTEVKLKLT